MEEFQGSLASGSDDYAAITTFLNNLDAGKVVDFIKF